MRRKCICHWKLKAIKIIVFPSRCSVLPLNRCVKFHGFVHIYFLFRSNAYLIEVFLQEPFFCHRFQECGVGWVKYEMSLCVVFILFSFEKYIPHSNLKTELVHPVCPWIVQY